MAMIGIFAHTDITNDHDVGINPFEFTDSPLYYAVNIVGITARGIFDLWNSK